RSLEQLPYPTLSVRGSRWLSPIAMNITVRIMGLLLVAVAISVHDQRCPPAPHRLVAGAGLSYWLSRQIDRACPKNTWLLFPGLCRALYRTLSRNSAIFDFDKVLDEVCIK